MDITCQDGVVGFTEPFIVNVPNLAATGHIKVLLGVTNPQ